MNRTELHVGPNRRYLVPTAVALPSLLMPVKTAAETTGFGGISSAFSVLGGKKLKRIIYKLFRNLN